MNVTPLQNSTTIQWLIDQTEIDGMYYLSGSSGGSNPISGINIMDNPDTVPWLKKDELILSTGYIFSATSLYKHIITDLHQRGCAGLGLKLNRYLDELPAEMLEQSNRLGFPIFCLPFDSTMESVSNMVYHNLFLQEMSETQRTASLYKSISEAALKRRSLKPLLTQLAQTFSASAYLTGDSFEIIECAPLISSPRPLSDEGSTLFPDHIVLNLKTLQDENPVPVREYSLSGENRNQLFWIFALSSGKTLSGYLIFRQEEYRFLTSDFDFIFDILPVLQVAMINSSLLAEKQRSNRYLFYSDLFSGRIKTAAEIEPLCRQNSFPFKKYRSCVVLRILEGTDLTIAKRRAFEHKVTHIIHTFFNDNWPYYTETVYDLDFVLFLFSDDSSNQHETSTKLQNLLKLLLASLEQAGFSCTAGISQCYRGAASIQKNYLQALNALETGQRLHPSKKIFSYYDNYVTHLLSSFLTNEKMHDIYNDLLAPLADYDQANDQQLLKTLSAFLANGLNAAQTARALYIHRNTMSYRLEQIEHLLGVRLHDVKDIVRLQLALYLQELIEL